MSARFANLTDRTRLILLAVTVGVVLTLVNIEIVGKERIIENGTRVLLPLAPRDPRSLLQGDYMALRYSMVNQILASSDRSGTHDGAVVISLGNLNEAEFVGIHDGRPLDQGQQLLVYRRRGEVVRLASDAFFFEEGSWKLYSNARFGELRVNADGEAVLVGLRDADGKRLGEALHH